MRTRISWATSLRVLLMLDCSRTELREVLLSWMSYSSASIFLNCVPSKPAVPQTSVMRVGSRQNSSSCIDVSCVSQVVPGVRKSLKPALAVGGRDHVVRAEHPEVLGDQRMPVDLAPDVERDLDGVRDEPVAFELHLPPRHVEARDQLLVGRGRGVGEDRLVELRLDRR